eukprot:tig00000073_g1732.t1
MARRALVRSFRARQYGRGALMHDWQREQFNGRAAAGGALGEDLNREGHVVVLANAAVHVAHCVNDALHEMRAGAGDPFVYNPLLVAAVAGVQSALDGVASFCDRHFPSGERREDKLYFDSYRFAHQWLEPVERARLALRRPDFYNGGDFAAVANRAKHTLPWFGAASADADGALDVRDAAGRRLVAGTVAPAYRLLCQCVAALAVQCGVRLREWPAV